MADPTLRALSTDASSADIAAVEELLRVAYGTFSPGRVQRYLAVPPSGWVLAELDGVAVATGGCVGYPTGGFGWIGPIATHPSFERRGLGRIVTQWLIDVLRDAGCRSVLDASDAGAPVYVRMGFDDHGLGTVMQVTEGLTADAAMSDRVEVVAGASLREVARYDAPRFGAERHHLLAYFLERGHGRMLALRSDDGAIAGYVLAQADVLGPFVADDAAGVALLLGAALTLPFTAPPRVLVPSCSSHHETLRGLGLLATRTLRHQRLGLATMPGRRELLVGQASWGEG